MGGSNDMRYQDTLCRDTSCQGTLAARYAHLETRRRPCLERARECAKVTLPYLCPVSGQTRFVTPYQGVGAQGVRNLAAKLLLVLLPPNSPFFRLVVDEAELDKVDGGEDFHAEIDEALGRLERLVMSEIETGHVRVGVSEALLHLLVTGNSLLYLDESGGMRVFHLDSYVVRRDPVGHVLEIITLEKIDPSLLPKSLALPQRDGGVSGKPASSDKPLDESVELYTQVLLRDGQWVTAQEVKGVVIPDSIGHYATHKSPWIPLRFMRLDGEDYGRSLVEEYLGDLKSLEVLTKAITQGSAAAAKVLFLVKPNATTKERVLADAPNGAIRSGNAEDVTVVQVNKYADFRVAKETIEHITRRLSYAFLVNSSIQRPGERVTAEEIRHMAAELETALGGVYSILSQEFQLPLIRRLMHQMERKGKFPKLPKGLVKPMIITGLEALGRGYDLMKLQSFVQDLTSLGNAMPELLSRLNPGELIKRLATARGLDSIGLIRSDEEMQELAQQAQMQEMSQASGIPAPQM